MQRATLATILMLAISIGIVQAGEPIPTTTAIRTFADLKNYQDIGFEQVAKSYLGSLEFQGCAEIVEEGLALLTMLKLAQPGRSQRTIERMINKLSIDGETPAIRFKAYLASMVFATPHLFDSEKFGNYANGDALFSALASRLQKETLAAK